MKTTKKSGGVKRISRLKKLIMLTALLLLSLTAQGCAKKGNADLITEGTVMVQIEMENGGIIKLELYPETAPITVTNFVKLAKQGFYDGLIFHRVIANFMIQGGDPLGTGYGGSDETIKGEFSDNGVKNTISHVRGVISMGRKSNGYNTASSQFFICQADATYLDGSYAAFGRVIEGMDVVDAIAAVKTDSSDKPLVEQKIKAVTVLSETKS